MKLLTRILAAAGFLAVIAFAADQTRSYKVTLPDGKIGTSEIAAGSYRVAVAGNAVKFTEIKTGKTFDVNGKVENLEAKTPNTQVHTSQVDGVTQISEIRPGGAKIRIDLRQQTTP